MLSPCSTSEVDRGTASGTPWSASTATAQRHSKKILVPRREEEVRHRREIGTTTKYSTSSTGNLLGLSSETCTQLCDVYFRTGIPPSQGVGKMSQNLLGVFLCSGQGGLLHFEQEFNGVARGLPCIPWSPSK